jgi:hypothetical protein
MRSDLTPIGQISMNDGRHMQVLIGGSKTEPVTIGWSRGVGEPSFAMSLTPTELDAFVALLDRAAERVKMDLIEQEIQRSTWTARQEDWATYGRPHFRRLPAIVA